MSLPDSRATEPGKLWSLWEMLELDASLFLGAVTKMRGLILIVQNIAVKESPLSGDDPNAVRVQLAELIGELGKLDARSALASALRLQERLNDSDHPVTYVELQATMSDIESRFSDHLWDIKLFVLQMGEAGLMQPVDALLSVTERPVEGFAQAYPSASFEIEEAAKCIALSRHTASVFHSMRALECGIRALCKFLEIPDATKPAEKNWGVILGAIKSKIDEKWPPKSRLPGTVGSSMESLYATLDAVKNPWRNATMHVEAIYAPHEALHILRCTGVFLVELSRHCDEGGREQQDSPAMTSIDEQEVNPSEEEPAQ